MNFLKLIFLIFISLTVSEAQDEVLDLIKTSGYEGEVHQIETEDGYLLKVHRVVPKVKSDSKFPVFLMHGLFSTAADFLLLGPRKALAFLLVDNGYDVWLGNARGNKHSMNHKSLSNDSCEFWTFSWHEIGIYDLPAMIDLMMNKTNKMKAFYVGHSQGATAAVVLLSMKPEYNEKLIQVHLMAPPVFMENFPHYFVKLVGGEIDNGLLDNYSFLNFEDVWFEGNSFKELLCSEENSTLCELLTFTIFGPNKDEVEIDTSALLNFHRYISPRVSVNQLAHYNQLIQTGKFRQFDFNSRKQNSSDEPLDYELENVVTNVYLYHALEDFLISQIDVDRLNETLSNVVEYLTFPNWNHADFVYGKNAKRLLYKLILRSFKSVNLN